MSDEEFLAQTAPQESKLMRPGEFLALCAAGSPFSLAAPAGIEFLEVIWNAGMTKQLVHVHDVQMASEVWMQNQIKKRLCRKN